MVFAIRPASGVYAIVIAAAEHGPVGRPARWPTSVGIGLNPASLMALMFIAIGGAYVIENWRDAKEAPVTVPYLGLAAMAVLSIAVAPSKGGAITEMLRLQLGGVLYLAAYALIRDRRGR